MAKGTETLGMVISRRREQLDLGVRELAREVQLDHTTILRLENNPDLIADPRTLRKVADRLKLDYNYLLSLNKTIDDQPEIREIARASNKMSPEDREKMVQMLRQEFADAFSNDSEDFNPNETQNF
jgi:transcriptional regulator with XRE-family HTH domain